MSELRETDELTLLQQTAAGDRAAFTELFDRYHQSLGAFVFGITKSTVVTEEIVLDVFLKIWMTRETLEEVRSFKAYLFIVARNAALSALRKLAAAKLKHKEWEATHPVQHEETAEDEKEYYLTIIDEAIRNLSPQRKRIFLLSRQSGLKYEDIGKQLGLSRFTVRSHIQQAISFIAAYVRSKAGNNLSLLLVLIKYL